MSALARCGGRLLADRRGGTAIEYGLILSLVVIALIASLIGTADVTVGLWNRVDAGMRNATGG